MPQTSVVGAFESPGAPIGTTPVQGWYALLDHLLLILVVESDDDFVVKLMA